MTRLVGGGLQNQSGTPLQNGFMLWQLSSDSKVTATGQQISSGQVCKIILDMVGNVAGIQSLIANGDLTPAGTLYFVRLFDYQGNSLWSSPQRITIPSGATFDLGTFVPTPF
jgi:hypothetical protein